MCACVHPFAPQAAQQLSQELSLRLGTTVMESSRVGPGNDAAASAAGGPGQTTAAPAGGAEESSDDDSDDDGEGGGSKDKKRGGSKKDVVGKGLPPCYLVSACAHASKRYICVHEAWGRSIACCVLVSIYPAQSGAQRMLV